MQTAYALIAANQGVSIIPACACSLRIDGVDIFRLHPDHVRADMVLAWHETSQSPHIAAFVDLVEENRSKIEFKAQFINSSLKAPDPVFA